MGNKRFLPSNHPFQIKQKRWFDGSHVTQRGLKGMTSLEVLIIVENDWGKGGKKHKKKNTDATQPWKKKSIFFNLLYWQALPVCHSLDVIHIEKNICESILGTLLDVKGK